MNSQVRPSETASVARSEPIETATSALRSHPESVGGARGEERAKERKRLEVDADELECPPCLHACAYASTRSR